jgi:hypothetical protein
LERRVLLRFGSAVIRHSAFRESREKIVSSRTFCDEKGNGKRIAKGHGDEIPRRRPFYPKPEETKKRIGASIHDGNSSRQIDCASSVRISFSEKEIHQKRTVEMESAVFEKRTSQIADFRREKGVSRLPKSEKKNL